MKKILILSNANENSPSIRYRLIYPLNILQHEQKVKYRLIAFFSKKADRLLKTTKQFQKIIYSFYDGIKFLMNFLSAISQYDVIIIKNYLVPIGGSKIEKIFWKMLKNKQIIYDIDDAIYLNQTRKSNKKLAKLRDARAKVEFWASKADNIFVSNHIIEEDLITQFAVSRDKFVRFLSCPYKNQYFSNLDEIQKAKPLETLRFIWLGSPSTEKNLSLFSKFIEQLPQHFFNVEVLLIGTSPEFSLYKNMRHVRFVEWSLDQEIEEMKAAHFGLNPLFDEEFERRKSAFKVIQYYRAGVIPIVSNVGINYELVQQYGGLCYEDTNTAIDFVKKCTENYQKHSIEIYKKTTNLSVEYNKDLIESELKDKT